MCYDALVTILDLIDRLFERVSWDDLKSVLANIYQWHQKNLEIIGQIEGREQKNSMFGGGHFSKLEAVFNKMYKDTLSTLGKNSKYMPGQKKGGTASDDEDLAAQETNVSTII